MGSEPDELFDKVFSSQSPPPTPPATFQERVYPELLLHQAPHGVHYYGSLQQVTRQFVDDNSSKNIMQFSNSNLGVRLREMVHAWDAIDSEGRHSFNNPDSDFNGPVSSSSAANSLFSWSTSDVSIAARKRQLLERSATSQSLNGTISNRSDPGLPLPTSAGSNPLALQRLPRVVERESNKFIQDRIEVIKAHHKSEASKKIDERKRRDHEMHLQRIKRKEAEYERSLKAAIALQNMNRQSGFFGSLFGFSQKQNSSSFTLDILEPEPYPTFTQATPPMRSATASPSKPKKSSLFSFRSPTKVAEGVASTSPEFTMAKPSMDDGSTRSVISSEDGGDNQEKTTNVAAGFEGLDSMLDSLNGAPSKSENNSVGDILSSPIERSFSSNQFIALEPKKLPVEKS